jgi:two-component system CheB/CheR fusion protein
MARYLAVVAWLLVSLIFALDVWLPASYSANLLYVAVILLALWTPRARAAFEIAAIATILIAIDHAFSFSVPGPDEKVAFFNWAVSTFVLWVTAAGVASYRRQKALQEAERAETEDTLRQSFKDLEDLKRALDASAIVAMTNVRGDITYVNDKFCEISKFTRSELIGANHRLVNSGLHSLEFFQELYRTIAAGQVWRGEIRNRAKDGTFYWVDTTIVPFVDERGRPYQYAAVRYDITERKRSDLALREQAALVQVGKMAAVVAHEVRNPLAGIRGAVQAIGPRLPEGSRERQIAKEMVARIDALNGIVEDLLIFARPRHAVLTAVPIAGVIAETVALLAADPQQAGVAFRVEPVANGLVAAADHEQLKQVLLNLLQNAAQAMHHKGEIRIDARDAGGTVELRIIDRGPGLSAEAKAHLFEPFFTTKHRGTGLGLATAKRILESHGGRIELDTPPEGGTVATVTLRRMG